MSHHESELPDDAAHWVLPAPPVTNSSARRSCWADALHTIAAWPNHTVPAVERRLWRIANAGNLIDSVFAYVGDPLGIAPTHVAADASELLRPFAQLGALPATPLLRSASQRARAAGRERWSAPVSWETTHPYLPGLFRQAAEALQHTPGPCGLSIVAAGATDPSCRRLDGTTGLTVGVRVWACESVPPIVLARLAGFTDRAPGTLVPWRHASSDRPVARHAPVRAPEFPVDELVDPGRAALLLSAPWATTDPPDSGLGSLLAARPRMHFDRSHRCDAHR